jgi:cysteine-rich repeat protein
MKRSKLFLARGLVVASLSLAGASIAGTPACTTVSLTLNPNDFSEAIGFERAERKAGPPPTEGAAPNLPEVVRLDVPNDPLLRGQRFRLRATSNVQDPFALNGALVEVVGADDYFDIALLEPLEQAPQGAGGPLQVELVATLDAADENTPGNTYEVRVALIDAATGQPGPFSDPQPLDVSEDEGIMCPADAACGAAVCGLDPRCATDCGVCAAGEACTYAGACEPSAACPAAADCSGRECGGDPICGASCGDCLSGSVCNFAGVCEPDGSTGTGTTGTPASCGDMVVDAGEDCDDGNASNEDACTNACTNAACGDLLVYASVEECDDGMQTASCDADCTLVSCGDMTANAAAGEACDDGNPTNADGCNIDCLVSNDALQVSAGFFHTCAVTDLNEVFCWGLGAQGRLGYGNANNLGDDESPGSAGPVDLAGNAITQVATGINHTCALDMGGNVYCWGAAASGQLGYGNTNVIGDNEAPGSVGPVPIGGQARKLALGANHSCALLTNDTVRCWGANNLGQLGQGNTTAIGDNEPASTAALVDVGMGLTVTDIDSQGDSTCVIRSDDSVLCWGRGAFGVLGNDDTQAIGDNELPSASGAVALGGPAVKVAVGGDHACAIRMGGSVRCWGRGNFGQTGYGITTNIADGTAPLDSIGDLALTGEVVDIAAGVSHTCAKRGGGELICWGNGANGRLGTGGTANIGDTAPVGDTDVVIPVGAVDEITLGDAHTCIRSGVGVQCWGAGIDGRLGYIATADLGDDEALESFGFAPL